ncbi:MAG TPA: hypothetical protein VHU15_11385, partial [Stellaceae bacterium]|nr:hypothetical protein [Stellaceae bacterium]
DGLGLARAIRERNPRLPIVLVTGFSDSAAVAGSEFPVLRKPYRLADLSRTIANAIGDAAPPPSNLVRLQDVKRNADPNRRS